MFACPPVSFISDVKAGYATSVRFVPWTKANKLFIPPPVGERRIVCLSVCVCVCVFVCLQSYLRIYTSEFFVHVTYGRGSVLLWRRSDTLRISGFMDYAIFAHKLKLLEVASRLRQWGSQAAFGWERTNTRFRQRTLGTSSCSQSLLGRMVAPQVAAPGA